VLTKAEMILKDFYFTCNHGINLIHNARARG